MPASDSHNPPAFDRRFTDRYVSLDAVVRFLCEDGKRVAAAKVATEFGGREALEAGER